VNEGYPPNWKHAVIHLNPETGEMHSDGDHSVRAWIQARLGPERNEIFDPKHPEKGWHPAKPIPEPRIWKLWRFLRLMR
jgi:hypothetical protein